LLLTATTPRLRPLLSGRDHRVLHRENTAPNFSALTLAGNVRGVRADGDPPHMPRGCLFQAWSMGELIGLQVSCDRSSNDCQSNKGARINALKIQSAAHALAAEAVAAGGRLERAAGPWLRRLLRLWLAADRRERG
jgi:hypothetical protein